MNNLYMKNTHQVYLISDSTGETLDRIFMALKAQFNNFNYDLNSFSFTHKCILGPVSLDKSFSFTTL